MKQRSVGLTVSGLELSPPALPNTLFTAFSTAQRIALLQKTISPSVSIVHQCVCVLSPSALSLWRWRTWRSDLTHFYLHHILMVTLASAYRRHSHPPSLKPHVLLLSPFPPEILTLSGSVHVTIIYGEWSQGWSLNLHLPTVASWPTEHPQQFLVLLYISCNDCFSTSKIKRQALF